jgi:signal transduction histidine kinase
MYASYAGSFVEDAARGATLSTRARDYARRAACIDLPALCAAIEQPYAAFETEVAGVSSAQVATAYSLAGAWAAWIQTHADGFEAIADIPRVEALLQRVVVNILANAVRFSPADRRVRVATSAFADTVEIRVIDHGPGIEEDRRDEIFLPFQRLGDTDNLTGLGLGLALARGLAEGMGGSLDADDTPGGGLTMVVSLPVVPGPVVPAHASTGTVPA